MNKIFKIGIMGLISLLIGCEKSEKISKPVEDGIFSGTYIWTYKVLSDEQAMTWSWVSSERKFTLELENGSYTCGGDDEGMPSSYGAGTFSVEKDKIIFYDQVVRNTSYSWDWILRGGYNFTFDGKKLQFSKSNDYSQP
jgi:hypothetical protein